MSAQGIVALLREAYENELILEKRTAYCLRRLSEIKSGQVLPARQAQPSKLGGFTQIAGDDIIQRLCAGDD
jgi:hypothetical protein